MKKEKNYAWFSIAVGALVGALSAGLAWLCGWLRCYDDEVKKNAE